MTKERNNIFQYRDNVGCFFIPFENYLNDITPKIFSKMSFIPVEVRRMPREKGILLKGYSPMFDSLKHGEIIPLYEIVVTKKENSSDLEVETKRQVILIYRDEVASPS